MNHNMSNDGFSGAAGDGACGDVCGGAAELGGAAWSGEADAASGAGAVNSVALINRGVTPGRHWVCDRPPAGGVRL